MFEALLHGLGPPLLHLLVLLDARARLLLLIDPLLLTLRVVNQPVDVVAIGGLILDDGGEEGAQVARDVLVERELPRVHDTHIHTP